MARRQKDDDYLKDRFRGFNIQRNYEYDITEYDADTGEKWIPEDAETPEEWKEKVKKLLDEELKKTEYGYYIFHDKDLLSNGDPKPLHVHAVLRYKNPRYVGSVYKALGLSRFENITKVQSQKGSLKYLLHITEQARKDFKHIYSQDELYIGGKIFEDEESPYKRKIDHFNEMTTEGSENEDEREERKQNVIAINKAKRMVELTRNKGTTLDYAREEIINSVDIDYSYVGDNIYSDYKSKLYDAEKEYFENLVRKYTDTHRDLKVILISAPGNSGKSTLAGAIGNKLADDRGLHVAATVGKEKTPDFVSGYKYQKVTIANEIKGSTFGTREFMNNFDNRIYAPISSRNNDVDWVANYILFTTSKTVTELRNESFRYDVGGSESVEVNYETGATRIKRDDALMNEAFQFTRRITYYIEITRTGNGLMFINVYKYDNNKMGYLDLGAIKVVENYYYNKDELDRVVDKILEKMNSETDILDGKVIQDDDIKQNKDDVFEYREADEKEEEMWGTLKELKENKYHYERLLEDKKREERMKKREKKQNNVKDISQYRNVEVSKNISQHDEFNAKLGVKDEDYIEHNENQTKHMTNPFDI